MTQAPVFGPRAIPLYLDLAAFLAVLEIPERTGRSNNVNGPMHGAVRALLLQQLHHRLTDSPALYTNRLVNIGECIYFTASWGEWHRFELPFLSSTQIRLEFRNLIDADYIKVAHTADPAGRVSLTINYALLSRDMQADERFRKLTWVLSGPKTPDQVISPPDQVISPLIIGSPESDQRLKETESVKDSLESVDMDISIRSDQSLPTAEKTPGRGAADFDWSAESDENPGDVFRITYDLLSAEGILEPSLSKAAKYRSAELIQSWIAIKEYCMRPYKQGGMQRKDWPAWLVHVLKKKQPAPAPKAATVSRDDIPEDEKFALDKYAYDYDGIDVERVNAIRRKYGIPIPAKFDTPSKPNYTK